jgi:tetratricopeptide (TPR) repeat protein
MAENARIDDLRRRVQKDPASIAFAQLAEEHRRAGQFTESVEVCRAGLAIHPTYLSARVTLGRALIELGQLDEARTELETVLKSAPENLAAIRGVAEICHKQGSLEEALRHYKAALSIARNDPELEQTVNDLSRQVAPQSRPAADNSLSLEDMRHELKSIVAAPPATVVPAPVAAPPPPAARFEPPAARFEPPARIDEPAPIKTPATIDFFASPESVEPPPAAPSVAAFAALPGMIPSPREEAVIPSAAPIDPALARAHETIAVLEQWLDAIHGSRAH